MLSRLFRWQGAGYVAGLLGTAVVTAIAAPFHETLNDTTVALVYLVVVLLVATAWGSMPALVASALSVLCFNFFFLPPVYTLTVADSQNWVALAAFFVVAVTAGQLSELAKRRAAEAEAARSEARLASVPNRSLLEARLDALVTIGTDGKINDANAAIEILTGRSRTALIGTDFSDCFSERNNADAVYREVLRDGFVRDRRLELRHRDGHVSSVLYNASLLRSGEGKVMGVVAAARSISTSAVRPELALSNADMVRSVSHFVAFASLFSIAVGLLALIGWGFGMSVLQSVVPRQVVIKPNAAIQLLVAGCALWLLRSAQPRSRVRKLAGQALAALVASLGLLSLLEHLFGWHLGIDELFFQDRDPWEAFGRVRRGLMAPITALAFLLIGLALLSLDRTITFRAQRYPPSQLLAFVANIAAVLGLLDFVLGAHRSYTHIALQTAFSLFVLSFAVVCARTGWGLGALLVSASDGGMLTRRLWPVTVVVPVLIGSVSWKAYSAGLLSEWSAITVMIVAMIMLLGVLTVWSGQSMDRRDTQRRRTEASLHRSEEELREAQRLAWAGSWWWDPETDTVTWSEGLYRVAGQDPKRPPPGFNAHSRFYTPESFARLNAAVQGAVQTGTPFGLELQLVRADGSLRWVTSRGEAERDASGRVVLVRGTVHDVTEHKQAEEALRRSEAVLNRAQEIAHIGSWQLSIEQNELSWSNEVFQIFGIPKGTPLTYETFLSTIHPEDREGVVKAWTAALRRAPYDIEHRIVVGSAIKWVREQAELEFDPDGHALRAVGTVQDITERKHGVEEIRKLNAELEQRVGARTADLEAALEREGTIGFRIQQMLLLTQPPSDLPGLQVAALTVPSQRIDGDFYDFFKHENQCLDVMVADVMGKGVPAALVAAATKSTLLKALCHLIAMSKSGRLPEPKAIVTLAHADMVRQLIDLESFVTLSYARFDLSRRQLDLVDCGHTGTLVVRAQSGAAEVVHGDNLPLGIREGEIFDQLSVSFEPGDLFLFYSDGITEMRNPAGDLFGEGRLLECVRLNRDLSPVVLVNAIRNATVAFAGSDRLVDDLTCVVVRIGDASHPLAHAELEIGSGLNELGRARGFVREFCRTLPEGVLKVDDIAALELAVNEVASNIIKHAYGGRADRRIQLEAEMFPNQLSIKMHHLGESFDCAVVSPPALDGSRESGFGVYMINQSVSEARYSRDDRGRNCITLIKLLNS